MGRETKILLGLLGLLAGVFMGVLSMKLLVPRPPAGTGPDVHADLEAALPHDVVEPPTPTFDAGGFAAAPPLVPLATSPPAEPGTTGADRPVNPTAGFTAAIPLPDAEQPRHRDDPFVAAASFEEPAEGNAGQTPRGSNADFARTPGDGGPQAPPPVAATTIAGGYVVRPGDSWWSVAERAYGDGRLYRALFAWNRTAEPRITLAPGTPLEIPPLTELAAAWPHLVPRQP